MSSSSLIDRLKELFGLIKDTAVDLKSDFAEESKFQQMRIVTVAVFMLDVVATLIVVFAISGGGAEYQAWIEASGPSALLMIRRDTKSLERDVEMILDGKYRATVDFKDRATGFAVDSVFTDAEGFGPGREYRPKRVEIVVDGDRILVPVGPKR